MMGRREEEESGREETMKINYKVRARVSLSIKTDIHIIYSKHGPQH